MEEAIKLTDEQLREWLLGEYSPRSIMQMAAINELLALRAERAKPVQNDEGRAKQFFLVECDCTAADVCPQGKIGMESRCKIIKRALFG